jgi:hypothetical protein
MLCKFLFTTSTPFKRVCKPSIALLVLLLTAFGFANKSLATYFYGLGRRSGETAGYNAALSTIQVPEKLLYSPGFIRGFTEIFDSQTSVYMSAGPIQECENIGNPYPIISCQYHPSADWYTVAGGAQKFVDTSVNLQPGSYYGFKVDYAGYGSWVAQIIYGGGIVSNIYLKNLSLSRPMDTVSAGGEAEYGQVIGSSPPWTVTQQNRYRLGASSSIRYYVYDRVDKSPSVTVSPALGDPYYEWYVTGL